MSTNDTGRRALKPKRRAGIAAAVIVVVIVLVIIVAGVAYVFVFSTSSHSSATSASGTSTTSTSLTVIVGSSTTTAASTTGTSTFKFYKGAFNYSNPLGPGGERVFANNTVQTYTSVQVASGSFTFFINPANYSGVGSGRGTLTVTTSGFCHGTTTLAYTFKIIAVQPVGQNTTVFFATPTPGNFTVPLSCTGPMKGVDTAINNPAPFLSTYPGEMTTNLFPLTVLKHLPANLEYYYTISATS